MVRSSLSACSACGPWWRLPLLLALVLASVVLLRRASDRGGAPESDGIVPAAGVAASKTVSLEIDFGDGNVRQFDEIEWREGMTVADALAAAGRGTDGVAFVERGSGETAFLTELGGVANEGAVGRCWTYSVNGEWADRSFAVYRLRPGDRVLWSFAAPR